MKNTTLEFLLENGMDPSLIDMEAVTAAFCGDMRAGLEGSSSSLMMIPTYFSPDGTILRNKKAIALDAGGTNFRAALTEIGDDFVSVLRSSVSPMPGTYGTISRETFLDEICNRIEPLLSEADRVAFCFSFPAEITPERDGRLIAFNKEVSVMDSEGMLVCAAIEERLALRGTKGPEVFLLLNDTIAAMFGGMSSAPSGGDTIGFILGTGTNTCYCEKGENIIKLGSPEGRMVINMEAGGFSKLSRGKFDEQLDAMTANPGDHIYEKMVSGGYLGNLILITLKAAAQCGVLSGTSSLDTAESLDLADVSEFLQCSGVCVRLSQYFESTEDIAEALEICRALLRRAAKLTVCNIAAIILQTDAGIAAEKPVTIAAEGSVFRKAFSFREMFDEYADEFIGKKHGRYYRIFTSDDMTLAGCAVAACIVN